MSGRQATTSRGAGIRPPSPERPELIAAGVVSWLLCLLPAEDLGQRVLIVMSGLTAFHLDSRSQKQTAGEGKKQIKY